MRLHRVAVIAIWLIGLFASGAVIVRTSFSTDMSAFLPRSPDPAQQVLVDQLRDGAVSRLILLAIEGADPDTLAAPSKATARDLRAAPGLGIVNNGEDDGFTRDRDVLWRYRYLLNPDVTPEHFTAAALHADLEADLRLLNSDLGMLSARMIPADPTGEMLHLLDALSSGSHPGTHAGVWMSPDHTQALS